MNALPTSKIHFARKTLRLLRIGWIVMRQYRAFRAFRKLKAEERKQHLDVPRQFTQSLLELGPLFVKLGQILSTRPDVLPEEYITELARLQEHVPPFPFAQVRMIIKEQFQKEIKELFRSFEEDPIAAASLAQVHTAVLNDGMQVAVKIQRPFARERINSRSCLPAK